MKSQKQSVVFALAPAALDRLQKGRKGVVEAVRELPQARVPAAHRRPARAPDQLVQRPAQRDGDQNVLLAGQHQRRREGLRRRRRRRRLRRERVLEPLRGVKVLDHGQLGEVGRGRLRRVLHGRLDLAQLGLTVREEGGRKGPQGDVAHHAGDAHYGRRVGPEREQAAAKGAGSGVGAGQGQGEQVGRVGEGVGLGHHAAHADAHEVELGDGEGGDQGFGVAGQLPGGVRARRGRGRANAPVVEGQDRVAESGEWGDLEGPCFFGVGEAVDQDDVFDGVSSGGSGGWWGMGWGVEGVGSGEVARVDGGHSWCIEVRMRLRMRQCRRLWVRARALYSSAEDSVGYARSEYRQQFKITPPLLSCEVENTDV